MDQYLEKLAALSLNLTYRVSHELECVQQVTVTWHRTSLCLPITDMLVLMQIGSHISQGTFLVKKGMFVGIGNTPFEPLEVTAWAPKLEPITWQGLLPTN